MEKKRKKQWKLLALIIGAAVILLGGCAYTVVRMAVKMLDSETVCDTYLEEILDAMNRGDPDKAYGLFAEEIPYDKFSAAFDQMVELWNGSTDYEYKKNNINITITNGQKTVTCGYRIYADGVLYLAEVVRWEGEGGEQALRRFDIVNEAKAQAAARPVGRLRDLSQFNGIQWLLLIVSAAALVFTILAEIHCIRHSVRLPWLWRIMILLLYAAGSISLSANKLSLNAFLTLPGYSRLLLYPQGDFTFTIFLPLGAIFYCCFYRAIRKTEGEGKRPEDGTDSIGERPDSFAAGAGQPTDEVYQSECGTLQPEDENAQESSQSINKTPAQNPPGTSQETETPWNDLWE